MAQHYSGNSPQNPTGAMTALEDFPDDVDIRPVQLTAEDGAPSRGLFYQLRGTNPKVGVHLMHPRTDQSYNYNILPLVMAGCAVIGRASRWPNNDIATIHELLLLDVAAGVRHLKQAGCEKIILLGNSGGGSLAAFYQAQATAAAGTRLKETPAGDALDLDSFDLPAADGLVFIGAHPGQGRTLEAAIDPSVVDELDPTLTDPELDLFNPANGFVLPPASSRYSAKFLARYKAAQIARIKRLDAKARGLLDAQRRAAAMVERLGDEATIEQLRAALVEHYMVVYRTSADPAFVDLNIDPDSRPVASYFSTRPDRENFGAEGLGRYTTPRAWLSTWSALSTNATTGTNLAKVATPFFMVHYDGDCGSRIGEMRQIYDGAVATDKQFHLVRGADHYGFVINPDGSRGKRTSEGTDAVVAWLRQRFL